MNDEERILNYLKAGHIIRVMDGRAGDGFVSTEAIKSLIATGKVEVFDNHGMKFIRTKESENG
jgi:hypothetical protein